MARGCTGSDSEEERHDRFRSERNSGSLNASKSLFSTGLQQSSKSRSPLRHLNSPPPRRDRRSPSERSRSRSKRRSKERKKSKERRISKEKLKRNIESNNERGTSKTNETRHSDDSSTRRSESRRRSRSKGRRRSGSKEKKRKSKEIRKKHLESEKNDTFLERFERRRPSVESEIVDSTIIYRDSSPEHDIQSNSKKIHESKLHKKKKEKKKTVDTEEGELISEEENNCFGPALPPKLESEEEDGEVKDNCGPSEGPALPPNFKKDNTTIGPTLPERLCSNKRSNNQEEGPNKIQRLSDAEEEIKEVQRAPLIGPVLPPRETLPSIGHKDEALYGPALPPPQSSEQPAVEDKELETETPMEVDDDLMIGPLPKGMELDDRVQRILEERAQSLRKQLENKVSWRNGRDLLLVEQPNLVYSCLSNMYSNICSVQFWQLLELITVCTK
ncbi:hypothetical protein O3M35_012461 [Rhynocoris fuscipes]|uniref:Uncharacterized protein n=1 Tax=Rhynocoris fuscipes TaxID=488301 RepID=A0AAW1CTN1_9HEMI